MARSRPTERIARQATRCASRGVIALLVSLACAASMASRSERASTSWLGPAAVLAQAPGAPARSPRVRVDGLAAVVGGLTPGAGADTLLRSDVELRVRVRLAGQAPQSPLPLGALPAGLVRATLDELVGELLIAREAARVRIRPPLPAEVQREREHIESEAGGAERLTELLRVLGAAATEIDVMARRRAAVSAFLTANLEGTTEISDAEVERIYLSGEHPFVDMTLDEAREPVRIWAAQAALERAVARWVGVLRARTPFRIVLRER